MTERDWEAASRARLERHIADTVSRMRDAADQIEREAKRNLVSASAAERDLEFQTYPRAAGQVVHTIQTLVFNLKLDNAIESAADAEAAWTEKRAVVKAAQEAGRPGGTVDKASASLGLYTLLTVLDGWIEGAHSNHEALDHRGENVGEGCWTKFHPADIRNMINDAARELGMGEFPKPETGKEDEYR